MSTRFFKSPRTASAAAAIAPARFAATADTAVRWRTRDDGALEVLAVREGKVDRYLVNDDGTTAPIESLSPSFWFRWGQRIVMIGWAIGLVSIVVGGLTEELAVLAGWAFGAALFVGGAALHNRAENLERRFGGGWHEPTDLHGWVPCSGAQLAAVEEIADDHDGLAFLRGTGGRTVEVYAMRAGTLALYWVDEAGNTGLASRELHTGAYRAERVLKSVSVTLWLALLAVAFLVHEHKLELIGLLLFANALVIFGGRRNAKRVELEQLMRQRADGGPEWVEIRTRLEVDDGD